MALHLNVPVGGGIKIGDAEIVVVEKDYKNVKLQITADRDQYPVETLDPSQLLEIWDGPPIFVPKE